MKGKVTISWHVERLWQRQVDATTSQGKLEGGALRGNLITAGVLRGVGMTRGDVRTTSPM